MYVLNSRCGMDAILYPRRKENLITWSIGSSLQNKPSQPKAWEEAAS